MLHLRVPHVLTWARPSLRAQALVFPIWSWTGYSDPALPLIYAAGPSAASGSSPAVSGPLQPSLLLAPASPPRPTHPLPKCTQQYVVTLAGAGTGKNHPSLGLPAPNTYVESHHLSKLNALFSAAPEGIHNHVVISFSCLRLVSGFTVPKSCA